MRNAIFNLLQISWKACLCLSLLVLFSSCEKDHNDPVQVDRVVLVYLGGDNNLSGEAKEKADAICKGWEAPKNGRLLFYIDTSNANPRLIEVVKGKNGNIQQVIRTYEKENSASKEVFARAIEEMKQIYPGSSYGLILFSHASGWLPKGTLLAPRSIIVDDGEGVNNRKEMELSDFAGAIPDRTFDFIVFEACFTAGIEVAYELKDKAEYILASSAEIPSPGFTYVYGQIINRLYNKVPDLKGFGQIAFNYFNSQTDWRKSSTLSLIKTSGLEALAEFVKANCNYSLAEKVINYQHFDRYVYYRLFFDFGEYYASLLDRDDKKENLSILINDCIIWKISTPDFMLGYDGFVINHYSGMTTYINQDRFPFLNEEYKKLAWSKAIR